MGTHVSGGFSHLQRDRHFNNLDLDPAEHQPGARHGRRISDDAIQAQIGAKVANENYRAELAGTFDTGPIRHDS